MLRGLRSCLTLIGLAVVVLAGCGAYSIAHRTAQPVLAPAPAGPGASPPPAAAPATTLDARLASAEAQIRQNAVAGRHAPASFTVTDPELTARIDEALARGEVQSPVSGISVSTVPGQMNIAGQAKVALLAVPFTMTAVPRVASGKAQLQVTGVDFGGLPVPGALAGQLSRAAGTDNLLGDLPFTVTSFRAETGRLVLEGTT